MTNGYTRTDSSPEQGEQATSAKSVFYIHWNPMG